jgi:hypothetical protein
MVKAIDENTLSARLHKAGMRLERHGEHFQVHSGNQIVLARTLTNKPLTLAYIDDMTRRLDTTLSASRTPGGDPVIARSIHAVDSPAIGRGDIMGKFAQPADLAQPAPKTSRRGFLMNTMVSAASLATAAAVVAPPLATTAPALEDVSFPELVARFIPLHQRCMEMRAKEAAMHENIDRLASEMTGIEYGSFADLEVDDPSYNVVSIARRKVIDDMRSGDPATEDRDLDELVEELEPVVKAIVNHPSKSLHDLGWQAEAITTLDQDLETIDDGDDGAERNLKTMLANIRRLAGPAAGRWDGADYQKSRAGKSTDPIFAAIEAHRGAAAAWDEALDKNDEAEERVACDRLMQAGVDLLNTGPATAPGIIAAVQYMRAQMFNDGVYLPSDLKWEGAGDAKETKAWIDAFLVTMSLAVANLSGQAIAKV